MLYCVLLNLERALMHAKLTIEFKKYFDFAIDLLLNCIYYLER